MTAIACSRVNYIQSKLDDKIALSPARELYHSNLPMQMQAAQGNNDDRIGFLR